MSLRAGIHVRQAGQVQTHLLGHDLQTLLLDGLHRLHPDTSSHRFTMYYVDVLSEINIPPVKNKVVSHQ